MVQFLPGKKSFAANLGAGLAQGLSEQLPKEIERGRLAKGLQQFSEQSANMSPLQQLAYLASIPGAVDRPQLIQSFGDLALKSAQAGALKRGIPGQENVGYQAPKAEEPPTKFPRGKAEPTQGTLAGAGAQKPVSITTTQPVTATIESYVPKTYGQLLDRGAELFESNPALYKNDPNLALQAAQQEDQQNQAINQAQQTRRKAQQDVQNQLKTDLNAAATRAGVKIPDNVYSPIEQEALDKVKKGEMTEEEAAQHYRPILDAISRDYQALKTVGSGKIASRTPSGNKDALRSLRNKFKERDDLENFADTMVTEQKLSFPKAYYLAYPISDNKDLNNSIAKLPEIERNISYKKGYPEMSVPEEYVRDQTLKVSEKILPLMKKEDSPLSVAEELKSRGYDPQIWMDYVDKNRKKANLSERQGRELDKPRDFTPSINDLWMFYFSGLDKIVEQ